MHRDTLVEQFVRDQAKVPGASGELSTLLSRISLAGRMIALEIMKAGFVGKLGLTGEQNVHQALRSVGTRVQRVRSGPNHFELLERLGQFKPFKSFKP